MKRYLCSVFVVGANLLAISLGAQNFEHPAGIYSKSFQKLFDSTNKKIDHTGDDTFFEFLRVARNDRARDRGLDLRLSKILNSDVLALRNKELVNDLLKTMRFEHNALLLHTVKYVGPETVSSGPSLKYLRMYNEIVNSKFYHFTEEERANARLFIDGSPEVNAYSFTGYPQSLYHVGLIEEVGLEGLQVVMGHELGHAVSKHVDHSVELYAYLLAGGYFMFDDSSRSYDGISGSQNKIRDSFVNNQSYMATIDPKMLARDKRLNPMEKSVVAIFSHFSGGYRTSNYSEKMDTFLTSISELSREIYQSATRDGGEDSLEDLIVSLEEILIDENHMKKKMVQRIGRAKELGHSRTRLNELFLSVGVFYDEIFYGMMEMSKSFERTADHYGVLLAGYKSNTELMAKFMGGKLGNVEEALAQDIMIKKDKEAEPDRMAAAIESWRHSHPTPFHRIEGAKEFLDSYQFQMLTNNFLIAYRDYLDLISLNLINKNSFDVFEGTFEESEIGYKKEISQDEAIIKYLEGKTATLPEGLSLKGLDIKNKEQVDLNIAHFKLELKEIKLEMQNVKQSAKEYKENYSKVIPETLEYIEKYFELVFNELKRIKKSDPVQYESLKANMLLVYSDWLSSSETNRAEDTDNAFGVKEFTKKISELDPEFAKAFQVIQEQPLKPEVAEIEIEKEIEQKEIKISVKKRISYQPKLCKYSLLGK